MTAIARKLVIPYPILLVIGGLALGFIPACRRSVLIRTWYSWSFCRPSLTMGDENRELIDMPDDGPEAVSRTVEGAGRSLASKGFLFSDSALVAAVIAVHRRGVVLC
ncbi:MAG: hypothetical protein ACT4QB_08000 [Gammaproteobacteria bacterium]